MASPHRTPAPAYTENRDSTASGTDFAAIGNMLASPYDASEDESFETLKTPVTPERPRMGKVRESRYQAPGKDTLMKRIQSFEGELKTAGKHLRDSIYSDDEDGAILAFDKPSPRKSILKTTTTNTQSRSVRPPTVVHFPQPTFVSPVRSAEPIRSHPVRPHIQIPGSPEGHHIGSSADGHQNDAYIIPSLPCSGTPVSPHLALPPLAPPRSPFAAAAAAYNGPGSRGSVSSISSESIKGYEVMKEKKALFREGEDELLSPFSPRKGRQESGLRTGPRRGVNRGVSTVDFWKRFSVSVRMNQAARAGGKER